MPRGWIPQLSSVVPGPDVIAVLLCIAVLISAAQPSTSYAAFPVLLCILMLSRRGNLFFPRPLRASVLCVMAGLVFYLAYGMAFGRGLGPTVKAFARYSGFVFALLLLLNLPERAIRLSFWALGGVYALAVPFSPFFSVLDVEAHVQRYTFIFEHPNHLAYALVPVLAFVLYFMESHLIKWILFLFLLCGIALTKSSGGFLATLIIIVSYFGKFFRRYFVVSLLVVLPLIAGILACGLYVKLQSQAAGFERQEILQKVARQNFGGAGSLMWRVVYWLSILSRMRLEPLRNELFGVGFGAMSFGSYKYDFMYTDPHNDYVRVFMELGAVGLAGLLGLLRTIRKKLPVSFLLQTGLILFPMFFGNVIVNPAYVLGVLGFLVYGARTTSTARVEGIPWTNDGVPRSEGWGIPA